jgi:hypothetical protein
MVRHTDRKKTVIRDEVSNCGFLEAGGPEKCTGPYGNYQGMSGGVGRRKIGAKAFMVVPAVGEW